MIVEANLYKFKIPLDNDLIEIGGGTGELCNYFYKKNYKISLFLEPDPKKFSHAIKTLPKEFCRAQTLSQVDFSSIKTFSDKVLVIMQDVIEHIPEKEQLDFFKNLSFKYKQITLIGRTPNLKSPFGLRNSFGDMTHIHRFTNHSLKTFLANIGFSSCKVVMRNIR